MIRRTLSSFFFFFNDTATTEIYTLSLHDALPISFFLIIALTAERPHGCQKFILFVITDFMIIVTCARSEEHTSELQSQSNLVCRLLLEKKKKCREHHLPKCAHSITHADRSALQTP